MLRLIIRLKSFFLTSEQYNKFLSLINEKSSTSEVSANMAGICCSSSVSTNNKWIVDSGANHHTTKNDFKLNNIVDVSKLDLRVDHPNGSSARINKIGNMRLSNSVVLSDVFVVLEFNVNLLSVHKLCNDNKCQLVFDEFKCVV